MFAGAFALIASACGSSGGSGASGSADLAAKYCALYAPCCKAVGVPGNGQACRAFFGALPAPDPAVAQQCVDDLTALAKDPGFCHFETPQPASCAKAYPQSTSGGTKKPGETCTTSSDCAPQASGDATCGASSTCQVRLHATAGDACVGTVDGNLTVTTGDTTGTSLALCFRSDGVFCDGSGVCQPLVAVGGACADYGACADTAFCDSGTCASRAAVGSACTSTDGCVDGAYCDAFPSGTCQTKLAEGAPCDLDEQCTTSYCDSTAMTCQKSHIGDLALLFFCQ